MKSNQLGQILVQMQALNILYIEKSIKYKQVLPKTEDSKDAWTDVWCISLPCRIS